ncbi:MULTISPECIES: hypothetical protein [Bradyrhizobium]|jgi:hypothetical protein|uniref:hypothetical protein n=1 Tax=Bradyrhizobium TaxID=374 RepID=UPI0004ADB9EE|nr:MULTISPECIES: hypothetical protein [Bradyrhizobium]MBR1031908.1 hypothetical protein [Bradyrhizobium liaoningense]MDI2077659.1 hypothetical protein [Bradyrhizobium sp. Mp27]
MADSGGWRKQFDAPIVLADGKQLVTLRDAIRHLVDTVPARERKHPRVLVAATVLTDAAEGRDLVMHARIAMLRALNRNVEQVFLDRKISTHWGKRKLKRDQ